MKREAEKVNTLKLYFPSSHSYTQRIIRLAIKINDKTIFMFIYESFFSYLLMLLHGVGPFESVAKSERET